MAPRIIFWTRIAFFLTSALMLALAAGFSLNLAWAAKLWPWLWPEGQLSFLFIGSILAAFGAGSLYIAIRQEWRAAAGGGLTLVVGGTALAIYLWTVSVSAGFVVTFAALAVLGLILLAESLRHPAVDPRPVPPPVRLCFWLFAMALIAVGVALILGSPAIFPWPLKAETSVFYGWLFIGLAMNYGYVAWHGGRADATVSLIGFLVYDLVLIGPLPRAFRDRSARAPPQPRRLHRGAPLQRLGRHRLPLRRPRPNGHCSELSLSGDHIRNRSCGGPQ